MDREGAIKWLAEGMGFDEQMGTALGKQVTANQQLHLTGPA
jgi:hypothetical protein